jgi:cell division protein FtsB
VLVEISPSFLAGAVILALQGAVAWFLRSMAVDFKEVVRQTNGNIAEIAVLKDRAARSDAEIERLRDSQHTLRNDVQRWLNPRDSHE